MDREVVKELIQQNVTAENITQELNLLLYDTNRNQQLKQDYDALKTLLSHGGSASKNAAEIIWEEVNK